MSNIRELINILDDSMTISADKLSAGEFTGFCDTGCLMLNALVSGSIFGGIPNNKISGFVGEQATGKSFFVIGLAENFLKNNPDGAVLYFDSESAIDDYMLSSRGVDSKRVAIGNPVTIQEFRTQVIKFLNAYNQSKEKPPVMMILDSLGQLSSTKEIADTEAGNDTRDMTKAQLIKGTFRAITIKLAQAKIPLLITNHVYAKIGSYIPENEPSGGSGFKYICSTIVDLKKKKDRDGKEVVGNIITAKLYKSRFTKEQAKADIRLSFKRGLDKYYGLLDLAEKYDIIKKVSTRYEMPDGSKHFGKAIYDEPEKFFTEEILARLDEAAGKEFKYGE